VGILNFGWMLSLLSLPLVRDLRMRRRRTSRSICVVSAAVVSSSAWRSASLPESGELVGERLHALATGSFGHSAVVEGEQVALDRLFGLGEVSLGDGKFDSQGFDGVRRLVRVLRRGHGAGCRRRVGVEEPVEHGLVEFFGRQPFGVAFGDAVPVSGEAGVAAVSVLVAVGGAPDEPGAAARARDEPGEEVVGAVCCPTGVVLASRDEGLLRRVKILTSTSGWCGAGWWRSRENTAPTEARLRSTVRTAVGFQGRPARVQQVGAVVDQGAVQ